MRWVKPGKRDPGSNSKPAAEPVGQEKQGLNREENYLYWSNDYPEEADPK